MLLYQYCAYSMAVFEVLRHNDMLYYSIQGKFLLSGKCPCTKFQGVDVAASI